MAALRPDDTPSDLHQPTSARTGGVKRQAESGGARPGAASTVTWAGRVGLHGHRIGAPNMLRAGTAEAVGTFFLVYTGTATAAAAALGKTTAGSPPNSLAVALGGWCAHRAGRWARAGLRRALQRRGQPSGWR